MNCIYRYVFNYFYLYFSKCPRSVNLTDWGWFMNAMCTACDVIFTFRFPVTYCNKVASNLTYKIHILSRIIVEICVGNLRENWFVFLDICLCLYTPIVNMDLLYINTKVEIQSENPPFIAFMLSCLAQHGSRAYGVEIWNPRKKFMHLLRGLWGFKGLWDLANKENFQKDFLED